MRKDFQFDNTQDLMESSLVLFQSSIYIEKLGCMLHNMH